MQEIVECDKQIVTTGILRTGVGTKPDFRGLENMLSVNPQR